MKGNGADSEENRCFYTPTKSTLVTPTVTPTTVADPAVSDKGIVPNAGTISSTGECTDDATKSSAAKVSALETHIKTLNDNKSTEVKALEAAIVILDADLKEK